MTADFAAKQLELSTGPTSGFARVATAQRRLAGGAEVLRGCIFTVDDGAHVRQRRIDTADEWWSLVLDHFGLDYRDLTASERNRLWRKVRATHEAWEAAGEP